MGKILVCGNIGNRLLVAAHDHDEAGIYSTFEKVLWNVSFRCNYSHTQQQAEFALALGLRSFSGIPSPMRYSGWGRLGDPSTGTR
jgi:hypothetical protein